MKYPDFPVILIEGPQGGERGWYSLVTPRTKRGRPGGAARVWDSLVAFRTKRGSQVFDMSIVT